MDSLLPPPLSSFHTGIGFRHCQQVSATQRRPDSPPLRLQIASGVSILTAALQSSVTSRSLWEQIGALISSSLGWAQLLILAVSPQSINISGSCSSCFQWCSLLSCRTLCSPKKHHHHFLSAYKKNTENIRLFIGVAANGC